ncbi:MAG: Holliday junction branch migration protein RuvA [Eubacterium sp.]|nr:Holliday junction branch migration protein RuvA [Eubacterium sp.]
MYSYIKGIYAGMDGNSIVIENNGIGYNINYPVTSYGLPFSVGEEVKIFTHFQVSENGISLFGFISEDDRELFRLLIGVSGIGPKIAIGILGAIPSDDLRFAVLGGDVKLIQSAPGVGKKSAERIIMELKDKFSLGETFESVYAANTASSDESGSLRSDVISGLTSLGFSSAEAINAYKKIEITPESTVEDVLGRALEILSNI